jgi:hypothetical protein
MRQRKVIDTRLEMMFVYRQQRGSASFRWLMPTTWTGREIVVSDPVIEILGLYRLPVTPEMVEEQTELLYGSIADLPKEERLEAEAFCSEQLNSVVLVEAMVHSPNRRFKVGDFAQAEEDVPRENWQVAYCETVLSQDGESVISRDSDEVPTTSPCRMAFFMHYWDSSRPLQSSYGEINCPAPQEMPERLRRLVKYELLD